MSKLYNVNDHFSVNPTSLDMPRSRFMRPFSHKTSIDVGKLYPIYIDEVLPGDSHSIKTAKMLRATSPLDQPIMDNLYMDTYYFFVPSRLVWKHWQEFCGEDTTSAWYQPPTYVIPQTTAPSGGWQNGSLADYLGIPTQIEGLSVNSLPFRAVAKVWNDWFRDENVDDEIVFSDGDATTYGSNTDSYITELEKGACVPPVNRFHDFFSSCLPRAQKGPAVTVPAIAGLGNVPVVPMPISGVDSTINNPFPLQYYGLKYNNGAYEQINTASLGINRNTLIDKTSSGVGWNDTGTHDAQFAQGVAPSSSTTYPVPANLYADMSGLQIEGATINQLRLAFQIQKLLERNAIGGTRYIELLRSHFGVTSPDSRLQRSEYLGGNRCDVSVQDVTQTSTGSGEDVLGKQGAFSRTGDVNHDFTQSFTEHGYILGFVCLRYKHTYQQGLERMWSRVNRYDFYWPALANIGNRAVNNIEIYAQGSSAINPASGEAYDDEVFGYQEAWSEYRYKPSRVSSAMRSNDALSLDVWHLADDYSTMPMLSSEWMKENGQTFDRVCSLANYGKNQQFILDIAVQNKCARCMPMYSVPGLIDHH